MATSPSSPAAPSGRSQIHGHGLYWEMLGPATAPAVVLLHHGLGSVHAWRNQIPALAQAGFRVLAYDRWGYGRSDPRPALDLPGFETDLGDLDSLLSEAGITKAALIGHSDGGTIALHYAARNSGAVTALVTVAAHIYFEPAMIPGLEGIRRSFETDARFREGLRRTHGEKAESVFLNWYGGWARPEHLGWDMRPLLASVACPTLAVQGELDEHATPQHARDIAAGVRLGSLWLIPGVHHMPPGEIPAEFNRRVLEFLAPVLQGRGSGEQGSGVSD